MTLDNVPVKSLIPYGLRERFCRRLDMLDIRTLGDLSRFTHHSDILVSLLRTPYGSRPLVAELTRALTAYRDSLTHG